MAAPPSKTLRDLNGTWVMNLEVPHITKQPHQLSKRKTNPSTQNKTLSDSVDAGLALQGIGWMTRKGIGLATVTLTIKQYEDDAGVTHIDITQTASGLKGTSEARELDNNWREHSDWLFGKVKGRTQWISAPAEDEFLNTNWEDGSKEWVLSYVESLDNGWTAAQTWGFQIINGERRYARNVVMKKGSKKEEFRLVYDFVPEQQ